MCGGGRIGLFLASMAQETSRGRGRGVQLFTELGFGGRRASGEVGSAQQWVTGGEHGTAVVQLIPAVERCRTSRERCGDMEEEVGWPCVSGIRRSPPIGD